VRQDLEAGAVGRRRKDRHGARIRSCSDPDPQTAVPVLPSWIIEPLWDQFAALLPERVDRHPLGCHNPRIADRVVFDKLLQVLVFGCAYQRIADQTCSARTLCRRRDEWIAAGVGDALHRLALAAYDRMLRVGPCPPGRRRVHHQGTLRRRGCWPSPVDRGKQGTKRSLAVEASGVPLGVVAAPATGATTACWPPPWTPCTGISLGRCPPSPRRPCTWTRATT
jgi:transposase